MTEEDTALLSPSGEERASRHEQALIAAALAVNEATELDAALRVLADTAKELLTADLVTLVAWDQSLSRGVVRAGAGDGVELLGTEIFPGPRASYRAAQSGEPVVVHGGEAPGASIEVARIVARLAIRISVPLIVDGAPAMTFQAAWRRPRAEKTVRRAISTLRTLGALTGVAYRAEEERRQGRDRARVEAILEAIDDGVWISADGGELLNAAARRLLAVADGTKLDPEAFRPRRLDGVPIRRAELPDAASRETGTPQRFRLRATRQDGVERVFDGSVAPIVADGAAIGTVSVFRDVTEEHNREHLAQRFLERLFVALPTAVTVMHPETREVLSANPAMEELVGYPLDEIVGSLPPFRWWTAEPEDFFHEDWAPADGIRRVESLFRRSDGVLVPIEIVRFWIRDVDGTPLAAVGLVTDQSERRRFEQQLLQSGKLAMIGELAAGVAHEINNPLFAVLGLVEFLLKEAEPGTKAHGRLTLVHQTGLEIKEIVRALLDFSRERSDEFAVVSLQDVLEQTVELVRRTSSAKHVEIVERYCDGPSFVNASANQLKQIFLNLVTNAQQAMPDGGTIEIVLDCGAEWAEVSVTDDGPGIPEGVLARIFEPFFTT